MIIAFIAAAAAARSGDGVAKLALTTTVINNRQIITSMKTANALLRENKT